MSVAFRTVGAWACSLASCLATASPLRNGNFDIGSLDGWTVFGHVSLAVPGTAYAPLQGRASALIINFSMSSLVYGSCASDPWNFTCTAPLPYEPTGGPALRHSQFDEAGAPPFDVASWFLRGSYIGQDVEVGAGDVLSWDWQMTDQDVGIDFGRFVALGDGAESRADVIEVGARYGGGTSRVSASYTFAKAGTYTVYFGSVQGEDSVVSSALFLDNVRLRNVAEPTPVALLMAGLMVATLLRGRRGRAARRPHGGAQPGPAT